VTICDYQLRDDWRAPSAFRFLIGSSVPVKHAGIPLVPATAQIMKPSMNTMKNIGLTQPVYPTHKITYGRGQIALSD
jgi:hypothetical protein